jgi:hypothetical protein
MPHELHPQLIKIEKFQTLFISRTSVSRGGALHGLGWATAHQEK